MRLFVAINPPRALRRELHGAIAPLREAGLPARWVELSRYHVTLKFVGEVHPDRLSRMEEALRRTAAACSRFELRLEEVGAFPSLRRPRVIWVGVSATPALRALKHDLEHAFARLGVERETRAFRPHLTVGRVDDRAEAGDFRDLERRVGTLEVEGAFEVESVDLMRSRLRPDGAVHTVEAAVSLDGE